MENSSQTSKEAWLHFEGRVHFILKITPFRLLVRARARKISHRELVADLDYLEHDFAFSASDLEELFPQGETVYIQLSSDNPDSSFVGATAQILHRHFQAHSLQLHLGFERVDDDLEDLLVDLKESGNRNLGIFH